MFKITKMKWLAGITLLLGGVFATKGSAAQTTPEPAGEIVVAMRYLLPTGVSHAHLFLYKSDGKLLRQLTRDDSGQDMRPVFAPDGETIVWTREKAAGIREFWQVEPKGGGLTRLQAAPAWYKPAQNKEPSFYASPYFINAFESAGDVASPPSRPGRFGGTGAARNKKRRRQNKRAGTRQALSAARFENRAYHRIGQVTRFRGRV